MPQPLPTASPPASWPAVEEATRLICGGKGNLNALAQLIRGLFDLGLGSLVEPVLGAVNVSGADWGAQKEALLKQAASIPGGKTNWASCGELFTRNLAALRENNPSLAKLDEFWRANQDRYQLLKANDGNFQVVDRQAANVFAGLLGGLADHRARERLWTYQCTGLQMVNPIAFDGAGYGWLLRRVLETTERTFLNYSCAVYVVEPELASACILMHLHDLSPWKNRLRFFVGVEAKEQFDQALAKNRHWMLPAATICDRLVDREALKIGESVAAVAEARRKRDEALAAEIGAYYEGISVSDWSSRYDVAIAGEKRLKVLGITSRYTTVLQYSMDELGEAVRASGHEFILAKEADDQTAESPDLQLIAEHKPDLLVLISRLRHENPRLPRNVPFLCWDQDNLPCMRTDAARASLDELTYVAGNGALQGYQQLDWPRRNCILAFQAAATHRYSNQPVAPELLQKHRCTFSYASNASGKPQALAGQLRGNYAGRADAIKLFDEATTEILARAEEGRAWDTASVQLLWDKIAAKRGVAPDKALRQEMCQNLRTISDRAFRHVALGWVAEYCREKNATLRLYGSGWETNARFSAYAAGFLAPGEEMRAVYQASEISLQLIETGFIHSRALDGLAAGGFFLYRYAPDAGHDAITEARQIMTRRALETGCVTYGQLDASRDPLIAESWAFWRPRIRYGQLREWRPDERCRLLDVWDAWPTEATQIPGLAEVTFDSREGFFTLADRFLADEQDRRAVASKLRQTVVERFSYDARWREFLAGIASGLRETGGGAAGLARAA